MSLIIGMRLLRAVVVLSKLERKMWFVCDATCRTFQILCRYLCIRWLPPNLLGTWADPWLRPSPWMNEIYGNVMEMRIDVPCRWYAKVSQVARTCRPSPVFTRVLRGRFSKPLAALITIRRFVICSIACSIRKHFHGAHVVFANSTWQVNFEMRKRARIVNRVRP